VFVPEGRGGGGEERGREGMFETSTSCHPSISALFLSTTGKKGERGKKGSDPRPGMLICVAFLCAKSTKERKKGREEEKGEKKEKRFWMLSALISFVRRVFPREKEKEKKKGGEGEGEKGIGPAKVRNPLAFVLSAFFISPAGKKKKKEERKERAIAAELFDLQIFRSRVGIAPAFSITVLRQKEKEGGKGKREEGGDFFSRS